jgi:hypothetical protein
MAALTITLLASLLAAHEANTSLYTKLDKSTCKIVETREEGGYTLQRCRGIGGFDLLLQSFDSRDEVRLAHTSGEDTLHLDHVTTAFNNVAELVEWRMAGKTVSALILRLLVDESDGPARPRSHPFLVVAKVRPAGSCVVQVVDARAVRDANSRARRFADQAQSSTCLWP